MKSKHIPKYIFIFILFWINGVLCNDMEIFEDVHNSHHPLPEPTTSVEPGNHNNGEQFSTESDDRMYNYPTPGGIDTQELLAQSSVSNSIERPITSSPKPKNFENYLVSKLGIYPHLLKNLKHRDKLKYFNSNGKRILSKVPRRSNVIEKLRQKRILYGKIFGRKIKRRKIGTKEDTSNESKRSLTDFITSSNSDQEKNIIEKPKYRPIPAIVKFAPDEQDFIRAGYRIRTEEPTTILPEDIDYSTTLADDPYYNDINSISHFPENNIDTSESYFETAYSPQYVYPPNYHTNSYTSYRLPAKKKYYSRNKYQSKYKIDNYYNRENPHKSSYKNYYSTKSKIPQYTTQGNFYDKQPVSFRSVQRQYVPIYRKNLNYTILRKHPTPPRSFHVSTTISPKPKYYVTPLQKTNNPRLRYNYHHQEGIKSSRNYENPYFDHKQAYHKESYPIHGSPYDYQSVSPPLYYAHPPINFQFSGYQKGNTPQTLQNHFPRPRNYYAYEEIPDFPYVSHYDIDNSFDLREKLAKKQNLEGKNSKRTKKSKKSSKKTKKDIAHLVEENSIEERTNAIPQTSFSCADKIAGYYADEETGCQVFHMCHAKGQQNTFTCPNGTLFNQQILTCDHWRNVDCNNVQKHYNVNKDLYKKNKEKKNKSLEHYEDNIILSGGRKKKKIFNLKSHSRKIQIPEPRLIPLELNEPEIRNDITFGQANQGLGSFRSSSRVNKPKMSDEPSATLSRPGLHREAVGQSFGFAHSSLERPGKTYLHPLEYQEDNHGGPFTRTLTSPTNEFTSPISTDVRSYTYSTNKEIKQKNAKQSLTFIESYNPTSTTTADGLTPISVTDSTLEQNIFDAFSASNPNTDLYSERYSTLHPTPLSIEFSSPIVHELTPGDYKTFYRQDSVTEKFDQLPLSEPNAYQLPNLAESDDYRAPVSADVDDYHRSKGSGEQYNQGSAEFESPQHSSSESSEEKFYPELQVVQPHYVDPEKVDPFVPVETK